MDVWFTIKSIPCSLIALPMKTKTWDAVINDSNEIQLHNKIFLTFEFLTPLDDS
jgi:hypothetical protein